MAIVIVVYVWMDSWLQQSHCEVWLSFAVDWSLFGGVVGQCVISCILVYLYFGSVFYQSACFYHDCVLFFLILSSASSCVTFCFLMFVLDAW